MKRIGILLVVVVALAWIGSKLVPRSESAAVALPAAVAEAPRGQAQQPETSKPEPERAVRRELKDPDAAQFRDVRANYTEEFGLVACGRVNAKNEFGGYTGFRRFVSGGKSVIL
ncbi:hypothetical protein ACYJW8_05180 [Frateuria aurantia]